MTLDQMLQPEEKILAKARFSTKGIKCFLIVMGIICIICMICASVSTGTAETGLIVLGSFFFISLILAVFMEQLTKNELFITNQRIYAATGFFFFHYTHIPIEQIDRFGVYEGLGGYFFHYARLTLSCASLGFFGLRFYFVENGAELRDTFITAIEKHSAETRKAQAKEIALALKQTNE